MSFFVVANVKDVQAVMDWCVEHIEEQNRPTVTVAENTNRSFMVRARFEDNHTATIFRLFWDGNAHH